MIDVIYTRIVQRIFVFTNGDVEIFVKRHKFARNMPEEFELFHLKICASKAQKGTFWWILAKKSPKFRQKGSKVYFTICYFVEYFTFFIAGMHKTSSEPFSTSKHYI